MKPSVSPHVVLASGSPRRRELLEMIGLPFTVRPVDVDESPRQGEDPEDLVIRLARAKAVAQCKTREIVLAADTIVFIDGKILGKPTGPESARRMLERLAGRRHQVLTGVALLDVDREKIEAGLEVSEVEIASMSPDEILWYVNTGEPLDKAGAYAIQGLGALFVCAVYGNYTNVVGLPLPLVRELFTRLGWKLEDL